MIYNSFRSGLFTPKTIKTWRVQKRTKEALRAGEEPKRGEPSVRNLVLGSLNRVYSGVSHGLAGTRPRKKATLVL